MNVYASLSKKSSRNLPWAMAPGLISLLSGSPGLHPSKSLINCALLCPYAGIVHTVAALTGMKGFLLPLEHCICVSSERGNEERRNMVWIRSVLVVSIPHLISIRTNYPLCCQLRLLCGCHPYWNNRIFFCKYRFNRTRSTAHPSTPNISKNCVNWLQNIYPKSKRMCLWPLSNLCCLRWQSFSPLLCGKNFSYPPLLERIPRGKSQ